MILMQNEAIVQDSRFQNESGFFDFGIFTDFINQMRVETPQAYDNWKIQEENIVSLAKENIYYDLIKSSSGFTELEEKVLITAKMIRSILSTSGYPMKIFQTLCFQFLMLTLSDISIIKKKIIRPK